jgi:hypothetical protein
MEKGHVEMYRRLLESVAYYSHKMLERLEYGSGDLPQWTNALLSESRTHLADVTHFLRGQAKHGIRYGQSNHGRAYMATANLRQIHEYANECLGLMRAGAGHFPAWAEHKISVVAEYMDLIGHWLENEATEGRHYGSYLNPAPGDADEAAYYRGRADGITNEHRNPYSPNDHRRKIYEKGFRESYGDTPLHPADLPGKPGLVYQSGYGSMMAAGAAPTSPDRVDISHFEHTLPPHRMLESNRQTLQHRQLVQQTGRRFGVPGFAAGQPGWAGAGGVSQMPHPARGMRRAADRSFGPGLSAGQGGVQTFDGGGGPMAVQTYGSLGYASMGDGSMDMAARGSIRRYSGNASPHKTKVGLRAARRSRKRK